MKRQVSLACPDRTPGYLRSRTSRQPTLAATRDKPSHGLQFGHPQKRCCSQIDQPADDQPGRRQQQDRRMLKLLTAHHNGTAMSSAAAPDFSIVAMSCGHSSPPSLRESRSANKIISSVVAIVLASARPAIANGTRNHRLSSHVERHCSDANDHGGAGIVQRVVAASQNLDGRMPDQANRVERQRRGRQRRRACVELTAFQQKANQRHAPDQ